jgi:FKBP-type peptidyl-prolyl cis-trans isomerase 2
MPEAQNGDQVKVHYTGKLDDGTVFDTSEGRDPLEFKLGQRQVIPGFEKAVAGMNVGESKTVKLAPEEAYGPYQQELLIEVSRQQFPDDVEPTVGDQFQMRDSQGQPVPVTVTEASEESVKLDANHPLAGQNLTFDIELIAIG